MIKYPVIKISNGEEVLAVMVEGDCYLVIITKNGDVCLNDDWNFSYYGSLLEGLKKNGVTIKQMMTVKEFLKC